MLSAAESKYLAGRCVAPTKQCLQEKPLMSIPRLIWISPTDERHRRCRPRRPLGRPGRLGVGRGLCLSSGGSNFSLWKIRSPTTATGLEIGVSWSYADSTVNANNPDPTTLQKHYLSTTICVLLSSTIVRCTTELPLLRTPKSKLVLRGSKRDSDPLAQYGSSSRQYRNSTGFGSRMVPIPTHQFRWPDWAETRLPLRAARY